MNKEQLELLPESDRKGRGFRYSHAYAQEAAGPPPAYHSTQIIHSSQPVGEPEYQITIDRIL